MGARRMATWALGPGLGAVLLWVIVLNQELAAAVQLECGSGATWSEELYACVWQGVLPPRGNTALTVLSPEQLSSGDVLKVHVRGVGPRLTASLLIGKLPRRNTTFEYRRQDATEVVFGATRADVGEQTVQVVLENFSLLGLPYTVLVHVHSNASTLAAAESRLVADVAAQCCRPRLFGTACARLVAVALRTAGGPWAYGRTAIPGLGPVADFCAHPDVLCGPDGSLRKLQLSGALDCGGAHEALAALAGAPSLAWLDLSRCALGFPLQRLAPLLARPNLAVAVLTESGLTGPMAYPAPAKPPPPPSPTVNGTVNATSGNDTVAIVDSANPRNGTSTAGNATSPTANGTNGTNGRGSYAMGSCVGLAPPGRTVLALSGNFLEGAVPTCLASQPDLEELQIAANGGLSSLPSDWTAATSLSYLDVSSNLGLKGPLMGLPPALLHLNASFTALGGSVPPLPDTLLTLDLMLAGLEGTMIPADPGSGNRTDPSSGTDPGPDGSGSEPSPSPADSDADDADPWDTDDILDMIGLRPELDGNGWRDLVNLTYLDVGSNQLRGRVPALPPSLLVLYLDSNRLSGPLPSPLPPHLIIINCSANNLTGPLPVSALDQIRYMDMSRNNFTGIVTPAIAASPQLLYFNASANALSGTLMLFALRLRLNSLQVLDLSHNQLSGPIPSYLDKLAVFSVQGPSPLFPRLLDLSYNSFSGAVPELVYKLVPTVVWTCRCTLLLALPGAEAQAVGSDPAPPPLSCPLSASPLDSASLYILWLYRVQCSDPVAPVTYYLAEWLTPGFRRLPPSALPALPSPDNAPPSASTTQQTQRYGRASAPYAARPVPPALRPYSWRQLMSMTQVPPEDGAVGVLPVRLRSTNKDTAWPIANILTVALASLTAATVLALVGCLAVRSWSVRRARQRRRARRREVRAARMAARQQTWAGRMEEIERELAVSAAEVARAEAALADATAAEVALAAAEAQAAGRASGGAAVAAAGAAAATAPAAAAAADGAPAAAAAAAADRQCMPMVGVVFAAEEAGPDAGRSLAAPSGRQGGPRGAPTAAEGEVSVTLGATAAASRRLGRGSTGAGEAGREALAVGGAAGAGAPRRGASVELQPVHAGPRRSDMRLETRTPRAGAGVGPGPGPWPGSTDGERRSGGSSGRSSALSSVGVGGGSSCFRDGGVSPGGAARSSAGIGALPPGLRAGLLCGHTSASSSLSSVNAAPTASPHEVRVTGVDSPLPHPPSTPAKLPPAAPPALASPPSTEPFTPPVPPPLPPAPPATQSLPVPPPGGPPAPPGVATEAARAPPEGSAVVPSLAAPDSTHRGGGGGATGGGVRAGAGAGAGAGSARVDVGDVEAGGAAGGGAGSSAC